MSFNYLEIERAAGLVAQELPLEVQGIELVEFPLPGAFADVNVALRLPGRTLLVFSLKAPWLGFFLLPAQLFRPSKRGWGAVFGRVPEWPLSGKTLRHIHAIDLERIVDLEFSDGTMLRFELFPARPNWIIEASTWKAKRSEGRPSPGMRPEVTLREFHDLHELENTEPNWFRRAYEFYLRQRQQDYLRKLAQSGLTQVQGKLSRLIKIRGQMNESLAESAKADSVRQKAEALKALLHAYPKTFRGKEVEGIALDPKLSIADNAASYFNKYKKLKRTRQEVELRLGGIEDRVKKLTTSVGRMRGLERLESLSFEDAFERVRGTFDELGLELPGLVPREARKRKEQRKWEKASLRSFKSKEGLLIWAGRNHEENEELVIRMARGNDMWMHLKGKPGAHVIVQLPGGKSPSLETLLDAANVVAYYSGVTAKDKVEVDYTFRKYVKRVSGIGGDKFLVTYSQNKTLMVKLDEARMKRLLENAASVS